MRCPPPIYMKHRLHADEGLKAAFSPRSARARAIHSSFLLARLSSPVEGVRRALFARVSRERTWRHYSGDFFPVGPCVGRSPALLRREADALLSINLNVFSFGREILEFRASVSDKIITDSCFQLFIFISCTF